MQARVYKRAPIQEAVIDLQFRRAIDLKLVEKIARRLKVNYATSEPLHAINFELDMSGMSTVKITNDQQGMRLATDDQADILILQRTSLTTARLAPYINWEALRDNAKRNFVAWSAAGGEKQVHRIGVRYINRIDIPLQAGEAIDLRDYVTVYPENPPISQKPLLGYSLQVSRPTAKENWIANITSTIVVPPPILDTLALLLDIDVYRTDNIPLKAAEMWKIVEEAREVKNQIFEKCITDRSRGLFQ